jgi:hypothetical protein
MLEIQDRAGRQFDGSVVAALESAMALPPDNVVELRRASAADR